jgi:hypothetical protein
LAELEYKSTAGTAEVRLVSRQKPIDMEQAGEGVEIIVTHRRRAHAMTAEDDHLFELGIVNGLSAEKSTEEES